MKYVYMMIYIYEICLYDDIYKYEICLYDDIYIYEICLQYMSLNVIKYCLNRTELASY